MISTKQFSTRTAALAALTLATLVAAGCESDPARQRSNKALGTLKDTRAEFVAGRGEVQNAVAQLGKLEARPANLTPVFKDYKGAVADVKRRAEAVRARVQDMRIRSQAYSSAWAAENEQLNSPELRELANARNERVAAQYQKVDASAQEVRAAYDPFIKQLDDAEKYLSNDLTYNAIAAAGPYFDGVRSTATTLTQKIDALIADLDATSTRLAPTTSKVSP